MKKGIQKFIASAFAGAVILSQGLVTTGNGETIYKKLNYTVLCVDGYKYLAVSLGYAATSLTQMYEPSRPGGGPAQPSPCTMNRDEKK